MTNSLRALLNISCVHKDGGLIVEESISSSAEWANFLDDARRIRGDTKCHVDPDVPHELVTHVLEKITLFFDLDGMILRSLHVIPPNPLAIKLTVLQAYNKFGLDTIDEALEKGSARVMLY